MQSGHAVRGNGLFYLVGLGLNPGQLTLEAKNALSKCSEIYLDSYTSRYSHGSHAELQKILGKKMKSLGRKEIEEGFREKLLIAKKKNIALCVFGNPLNATTHIQLLLDAKSLRVKCKIVHGISVQDCLSESGLSPYRFGRTVTIVSPKENFSPESFYDYICKNLEAGLHTLCLLDIEAEKNRFMPAAEAAGLLESIDSRREKQILQDRVCVALCALGSSRQKILAGSLGEIKSCSCKLFPQSLIVCAELNEKEKESLHKLHAWKEK